jgi:hypothetical protein
MHLNAGIDKEILSAKSEDPIMYYKDHENGLERQQKVPSNNCIRF